MLVGGRFPPIMRPPSFAPGGEKSAAFVEAQGAMSQRELVRQLVDGEFGLFDLGGLTGFGVEPEEVDWRVGGIARMHGRPLGADGKAGRSRRRPRVY